jgi:tRNA (guanine37-N1)-methyltransferase
MNLPASAVEFLDAFRGAFNADRWKDQELPTVHVYMFKKGPEADEGIDHITT